MLSHEYDVFISYSHKDERWVRTWLLPNLEAAHLHVCIDFRDFGVGMPILVDIERAVEKSQKALLILTPNWVASEWANFELLLLQTEDPSNIHGRLLPLLLEPCEIPKHIAMLNHADFTARDRWEDEFQRLMNAFSEQVDAEEKRGADRRKERSQLMVSASVPPLCPYPGMVPFRTDEATYFFGRRQEIDELLQHLRHGNMIFVIGPSGSGKSSLIFAGLLAELHTRQQGQWLVRTLRPGREPLRTLSEALEVPGISEASSPEDYERSVAALLERHSASRLLLVIDQFEELFLPADQSIRSVFVAVLQLLRQVPSCTMVLTMWSDFYSALMQSDLWPIAQFDRVEIAPLCGEALREAIIAPSKALGVSLESGLVERLLADAAPDEPGVLPLLQETMVLLWEKQENRLLTLRAYEELGRGTRNALAVAIATKADATLADLPPLQQGIARRIFIRLVHFGEGRADIRRQQPVAHLQAEGDDPTLFHETLQYLARNRLLTLSGQAQDENRYVDIAHEALIPGWPTLQAWLTEEREAEQTRRRLQSWVDEWVRRGRGNSGLLDEAELAEAERWLANPGAVAVGTIVGLPALIRVSREAIEEVRQRELNSIQVLAAEQQRRAEVESQRAEEQHQVRRRLGWFSVALAVLTLFAFSAAWVAISKQREAQTNAQLAQQREQEAVAARIRTEEQKEEIDRARDYAEQSRLIAVVEALSMQALHQHQQFRQDETAALLARQAFLFKQDIQSPDLRRQLTQNEAILRTILSAPYFHTVLYGHKASVTSVAFSSAGDRFVTGSSDRTVRVRSLRQSDFDLPVLGGLKGGATSVTFGQNDRIAAAASADHNVYVWDLHHPDASPKILRGPKDWVTSVAIDPQGKTLVAGSFDRKIHVWKLQHSNRYSTLPYAFEGTVWSVAFSPQGNQLAAGSSDQMVRLWNPEKLDSPPTVLEGHNDWVLALTFHPEGHRLASASADRTVRVWNLQQLDSPPTILDDHGDWVTSVAFTPDGLKLASGTGSRDRRIRIWDLEHPQTPSTILNNSAGGITSVAFDPKGHAVTAGSGDGKLHVWRLSPPQAVPKLLHQHQGAVTSVAATANGNFVVSGSVDRNIHVRSLDQQRTYDKRLSESVTSVAMSSDERMLAASSGNGVISVWELSHLDKEPMFQRTIKAGALVAFSPEDYWLAVGSANKTLRIWDLSQPDIDPIHVPTFEGGIQSIAFGPNRHTLAVGTKSGTVQIWDLQQGIASTSIELTGEITSVAFSPDGSRLAVGSKDFVYLWELHQASPQRLELRGHTRTVLALAFSPNGYTLVSGSADGTLRMWDARQPHAQPIVLRGHTSGVTSVAFVDRQTLISGSIDQTVRLWIATPEKLAEIVCEQVSRNLTPHEWKRLVAGGLEYERTCDNLPIGSLEGSVVKER